jgi:hypothetical protein
VDAGARTIGWHLTHHHQTTLSRATVHRILTGSGAVIPEPAKRPKASYLRFAAAMPNETWQSDFTHYRLATGADAQIVTPLDDHSRFAGGHGGSNHLEHELRRRNVVQKNSRPNHPTTCGKVCEESAVVLHRAGLTPAKV